MFVGFGPLALLCFGSRRFFRLCFIGNSLLLVRSGLSLGCRRPYSLPGADSSAKEQARGNRVEVNRIGTPYLLAASRTTSVSRKLV